MIHSLPQPCSACRLQLHTPSGFETLGRSHHSSKLSFPRSNPISNPAIHPTVYRVHSHPECFLSAAPRYSQEALAATSKSPKSDLPTAYDRAHATPHTLMSTTAPVMPLVTDFASYILIGSVSAASRSLANNPDQLYFRQLPRRRTISSCCSGICRMRMGIREGK